MALNTAHSGANGVILFNGELILLVQDNVELSFEITPANNHFKGTKKGKAYLTNQRLIFQSTSSSDSMKSFAMPFYYMKQVEVKQPIFGANALTGVILAQPNGNWEGKAEFKFTFKAGGAIEFGEKLLRVATKAPKGPPPAPGQAPPPQAQPQFYPQPMPNGNMYGNPYPNASAPPAGYSGYPPQAGMPPPAGYPPAGYPPAGYPPAGYPQAGTAYQNGQQYPPADPAYPPPAYSEAVAGAGVMPSAPPATDAKQQTATAPGGNAYYNPANPQQAYIPQQTAPQSQPPPYSEKPKME